MTKEQQQELVLKFCSSLEIPYPLLGIPSPDSLRITLPNGLCDPASAHKLSTVYFDYWILATGSGLNIMNNRASFGRDLQWRIAARSQTVRSSPANEEGAVCLRLARHQSSQRSGRVA